MSRSDEEETLYDWYMNPTHRETCPRCSTQKVTELDYAQDKNGVGVIYRCLRCLYEYGLEDESSQGYFDKNANPTIYFE